MSARAFSTGAVAFLIAGVVASCARSPAPAPMPVGPEPPPSAFLLGALPRDAAAPAPPPATATFVDLRKEPVELSAGACESLAVSVVDGRATLGTEALSAGDLVVVRGQRRAPLAGSGVAFVAVVKEAECEAPASVRVVRSGTAPPLSFAKGTMEARLDGETALAPTAYVGRLRGTAPVAAHAHDGSWEILGAFQASGTFTLDGVPKRLGPRQVVVVPPGTKHSWQPDDGAELVAVQMYVPPGPEQRFKALAKDAASAAAPPDAGAPAPSASSRPR